MNKKRRSHAHQVDHAASSSDRGTPSFKKARRLVENAPQNPDGWKALGEHWLNQKHWDEALEPIERALELAPRDPEVLEMLARVAHNQGDDNKAIALIKQALDLDPGLTQAHFQLSKILFNRTQNEQALVHIDQALTIQPKHLGMLSLRGNILYRLHRYQDAIDLFDNLLKKQPTNYSHWNNAANLRRDLGLLDEADSFYRQSIELTNDDAKPYSNRLTALHYNPNATRAAMFEVCREWEKRYGPTQGKNRPRPSNIAHNKRLSIGMISDGFRQHPVGRMITTVLEEIAPHELALYAYSTNNAVDPLTIRIRKVTTQWMPVAHLSDEALAQQVRDDKIDILIDLAGHNTGSRMRVMAMQPAPLLVKWVGGLINTTGLSAMDYLLTDKIESPGGEDAYYTEKLIRMPDDYICYDPGSDQGEVQPLPALHNGYVTLGCFNNPSKVNTETLAEWATLMHQLPNSRLFLKGFQYSSEELTQRVLDSMSYHGIESKRLIIEGPSPHAELLEAYNRVDIALDPWPYSGGLTTCEALLMGVPVVTLPGPTFAGRHSATHLVNAGMPELVTQSWDEYRARVIELASDLESLATIRQHLRDVLLQSPVCDGPRFARHFTNAMRAIWQRYCDNKAPAALTLDREGEAQFEGDDAPVEIKKAEAQESTAEFRWQLEGKLIAVDNGGQLLHNDVVRQLLQRNALELIAFDPSSQAPETSLKQHKGVHYYPNATLGDGQSSQLHACLDSKFSATLTPLGDEHQPEAIRKGSQVLTRLPLSSIALDSIQGIPAIDWLVLDDLNDANAILDNGTQALKDTLLLQVKIAFQPTHERQPNLAEVQHWASRHGFRFYRLHEPQHRSHLSESVPLEKRQATELNNADALFIPNAPRMATLDDNQRMKLAFILHSCFDIKDLSHELVAMVNPELAEAYLQQAGITEPPARREVAAAPSPTPTASAGNDHGSADDKIEDESIFVIGCGHSGTTLMASILGAHPEIHSIPRETYWFLNNPNVDREYPKEKRLCLQEGKRLVCEKTPRHIYRISEIQEKFPNAKFVAMLRDGRDVVGSLKNRSGSLEGGIKRWIADNRALLQHEDNPRVHWVKYEDLVTDQVGTMQKVFDFLTLDYTDKVFDFHKKDYNWFGVQDAQETDGKGEKNHLQRRSWQMTQPIHDRRGVWKDHLDDNEVVQVISRCSDMMRRLGYSQENY
ncbi:O-linked N-acetylglucosamine transferase family protein [Onishia niordana]|uniref:O-linked N-acetylglucosamine transferase family protein n=1 Tax=Onishia niordana TaxID=2508711 RepID=UPI00109F0352|nr:sulfotransferase [Halomonas niordiana]